MQLNLLPIQTDNHRMNLSLQFDKDTKQAVVDVLARLIARASRSSILQEENNDARRIKLQDQADTP